MRIIPPILWAMTLIVWVLNPFSPDPGFPQGATESARNPAPVFGFLRDVVVNSQMEGVKVALRGEGLTKNLQNFTLAGPPRLVIDFPGGSTSFGKKSLYVGHPLLKEIRLGQHPDKLRVVLIFPAAKVLAHRIVQEEGGPAIIIGKIEDLPQKGKKPEPKEKEEKFPLEKFPAPAAVPPAKTGEEKIPGPLPEKLESEKTPVKAYSGEKITLDFIEADIRSVLALISETAKRPIVPEAGVQGTITLRLTDVPWDQALDVILSIYSLKRVDEGDAIRILPR